MGHDWRPAESMPFRVCRRCLIRDTSPEAERPCQRWAERPYLPTKRPS